MTNKFTIICADCPWSFSDTLSMSDVKRGAEANYALLDNKSIMNLQVRELADPDGAVLALWVPSTLLSVGLETMAAWGFNFKQIYVWDKVKIEPLKSLKASLRKSIKSFTDVKETSKEVDAICDDFSNNFGNNVNSFGMGRLFRQCHEVCLIGTNNNGIYNKLQNKSQRSVSHAPNLKHSAKPDDLQKSLEIMFPGAKMLEIFARRQLEGWTCIGNQAPETYGEDIRKSLSALIS